MQTNACSNLEPGVMTDANLDAIRARVLKAGNP